MLMTAFARVRIAMTYGIYAAGFVFFGKRTDLERELDEGAGDEAREDYGTQRVVHEGFEVALSWTCVD
jgi:hypothetical protein